MALARAGMSGQCPCQAVYKCTCTVDKGHIIMAAPGMTTQSTVEVMCVALPSYYPPTGTTAYMHTLPTLYTLQSLCMKAEIYVTYTKKYHSYFGQNELCM